jgi:hypothetical protein
MKLTPKGLLAISLTLASLSTFTVQAKDAPVYLNVQQSASQVEAQQKVLKELQEEMIAKFDEIESLIASGKTKQAFLKAKEVLDSVRIKTGIDPKIRMQESFLVSTVFGKDADGISSLTEDQRNLVIKTISNFRGGLFMDIMNLSKRTTLLYIKAFEAELSKQGGLTKDDKAKIINDLVKAAVMPLPVEDKKGKKIIVLEEEVANEDHTYIFNRELKMYLISNNGLKVTEEDFDEAKIEFKNSLQNSASTFIAKALQCVSDANSIQYMSDRNYAQKDCFYKHLKNFSSMKECSKIAGLIYYLKDGNVAQRACFNKFNN